jgi:hypothetical protein
VVGCAGIKMEVPNKGGSMKVVRMIAFLLFCGLVLTGCNETGTGSSQAQNSVQSSSDPVYLDKASAADFDEHAEQCPGGGAHKRTCVVICHVPPGNPDARHTIRISDAALDAHLKHGINAQHENRERDYLGDCAGSVDPVDGDGDGNTTSPTPPPTDGSMDGGGTTDGGTAGGGTQPTPPPTTDGSTGTDTGSGSASGEMCQYPMVDVDQNCDGYNDTTGDPVY